MKKRKIYIQFVMMLTVIFIGQSCRTNYPVPTSTNVDLSRQPELQAEGKRLTMLMCASCHYDDRTRTLSGKRIDDTPGIVGKVYSANLTNDSSSVAFRYTDQELMVLLRTGISRDGEMMPYMLRPNLADEDIKAIITFLRSNDELVSSTRSTLPATKYTALGRYAVSRTAPVPLSSEEIRRPTTDTLTLGRYLVDNLGCYHCHSKSFLALDYQNPEQSKGYMGGGNRE